MKEIIKKAEDYALSEIDKYQLPSKLNFHTSNNKGEELAKKIKCDIDIVKIGSRLMDIKLGEAKNIGKIQDHVEMGIKATNDFLSKFNISQEKKNKIINCVEAHHNKKWTCIEAEICANADCYRFLLLRNWLAFLNSLGKEKDDFDNNLIYAESKLEEKWNILSLDICKKELKEDYHLIKKIIEKARK
ncbi:MAG: hypothetical protein AABX35_00470 [Nanoarchaeota archaeon]